MSPRTSADVIRKFAMALRGQSPDEYNAEDNHTRNTAERQIETALQVTGFLMGTPLVPNKNLAEVTGPWRTLSAVHPSVSIVSDREGDRWRRVGSTSRFGDAWLLFDKKIGAWRPWEISLDRASLFAPFSELEKTTKAEYPHPGLAGLTVLGPEIFTDGEVINWCGENFVRQPEGGTVQHCLTEFAGDRAYLCALSAGHYGDHTTGRGEHWQKGTTPQSGAPRFPQPPSPVDTGPWATLEQIPDNVEFRGTFSGGGGPTDSVWFKRDGALWHSRPGRPAVKEAEDAYLGNLSPFVADVAAS